MRTEFDVNTNRKFESIDITERVRPLVRGFQEGVAVVTVKHTTCSIIINEAEEGLMEDFLSWARRIAPPEGQYSHNRIDNNGHAHVISAIIGNSRTVPIINGNLDLGTWQRIILLEFDGPRKRRVQVDILSSS